MPRPARPRTRPPGRARLVAAIGASIRRHIGLVTVVGVMLVTLVQMTASVHASVVHRHASRRRPPRPLVRPWRGDLGDWHRPRRPARTGPRWLQTAHVVVPGHGTGRRRRLHVLRRRPSGRAPSLAAIIAAAARRHHVAPGRLLAVARCESHLDPRAVNPSSGASGLFQFMPATFYRHGGHDLWDPAQQAEVAARMFAEGDAAAWACA